MTRILVANERISTKCHITGTAQKCVAQSDGMISDNESQMILRSLCKVSQQKLGHAPESVSATGLRVPQYNLYFT
jgi:hypothetical protein